jgi:5-formyltetrahydrofolate cyclo-ligase
MGDTAAKSTVRAWLLQRRSALSPDVCADASRRVLGELIAAVAGRFGGSAPTVAAYVPFGSEPGGQDLPEALYLIGARVLLPVLRPDNDLDWAEYTGELIRTPRGLREPAGPMLGVGAIAEADLLVVPAVAVDRHGVRLGRGGGSFDRALDRVRAGAPVVALLHDGELVDALPAEAHDRLVSAVITPSGGWCDLPDIGRSAGRSGGR